MSKVDQRKASTAEKIADRSAAGKASRGEGIFIPKKSKRDEGLQERIDLVVRLAKEAEALEAETANGQDPIRHNRWRWSFRTAKGSKIG